MMVNEAPSPAPVRKAWLRSSFRAVALALLVAAPAAGQTSEADGAGRALAFRLGLAGGGGLRQATLVPGLELRSGTGLHMLLGVDAYLPRSGRVSTEAPDTARGEVVRTSLSPPRMRAGVGYRTPVGAQAMDVRAYVGQQGVVEGFQPLIGGGVLLEVGGWGLGVDGTAHRGTVYERVGLPENQGLITETPLRRTWTPRWEVSAHADLGGVPRDALRPAVGGVLAGAAGALIGGVLGAVLTDCSGSGCAAPAIAGAAVGESLALPVGVHIAAGRRGSLAAGMLASVGIAAAGTGVLVAAGSDAAAQGVSVMVPFGQLIAAIAIERRTAARR